MHEHEQIPFVLLQFVYMPKRVTEKVTTLTLLVFETLRFKFLPFCPKKQA